MFYVFRSEDDKLQQRPIVKITQVQPSNFRSSDQQETFETYILNCYLCDHEIVNPKEMVTHLQSVHGLKNDFLCNCGYKDSSESKFLEHVSEAHAADPNFTFEMSFTITKRKHFILFLFYYLNLLTFFLMSILAQSEREKRKRKSQTRAEYSR